MDMDEDDEDFEPLINRTKNKRLLGGSAEIASAAAAPSSKYRKLVIAVSDDDEDDSSDNFVDAIEGNSGQRSAGYIHEITDDDDFN
jgi:hypothetical protein